MNAPSAMTKNETFEQKGGFIKFALRKMEITRHKPSKKLIMLIKF